MTTVYGLYIMKSYEVVEAERLRRVIFRSSCKADQRKDPSD